MQIKEIYEHFCIPQPLQQHMIDVASVAMMICDRWQGESIDKKSIITAALLHDLWNLIKIDFSHHCNFYEDNPAYWIQVKNSMIEKYGHDVHHATLSMIQELSWLKDCIKLIDTIGIVGFIGDQWYIDAYIVDYADMRCGIDGITSLDERLLDAKERYQGRASWVEEPHWSLIRDHAHSVETRIFDQCDIQDHDITHDTTRIYAEQLWDFELENVEIKTIVN
jgi:hypothetical protein